ncbi:Pyridoxal phosphate phosphatase YigL [Serratia symbiotica]|nr:Pyridoxal phosphate phosphatase YigL [Serratia symbiotica]
MYHIVASDLDGTLLLPNHTFSLYTKETLQLLTKRNIHFIFATGRHHIDVLQIRENLDINAFMITSNGTRIHNTFGELISSYNLDKDIAYSLCSIMHHDMDIVTNVYRDHDWLINRESPEQQDFFKESTFKYQIFNPKLLETSGICKIYFICNKHEKLLSLEHIINVRWGDKVNVSFSLPTCLEVMSGNISKGHALDEVTKIIGYSLKDCIAFGDGMNDLEMLSMVGKGCIMENAHQRLKDKLPNIEVIGSNINDSVSHYLRKIFLI